MECGDGQLISSSLVDDLIPDCVGPDPADEPLLKELIQGGIIDTECSDGHIPCVPGHNKCFPISSLCVYDHDQLGNLRYVISGHNYG